MPVASWRARSACSRSVSICFSSSLVIVAIPVFGLTAMALFGFLHGYCLGRTPAELGQLVKSSDDVIEEADARAGSDGGPSCGDFDDQPRKSDAGGQQND